MPYKCCVPNCVGNYGKGPKVHVFSFPLNENCGKRWLNAIPRSDLVVTIYTRVCNLHFAEGSIMWESTFHDEKTGHIKQKKPR
ncbi:unnamed protein product [Acanthoscelides obtectus]|uniref:THAP-type domain-containing protein n=1 Tax=Acanthoscelides obtectus TaxID=200917 RepID=A0A9P0LVU9_ACAOB|nr:unnamed protein product [Acanthoscelides obtectus]CAK1660138.1 hypothetical protein AOBTE_LOCUS21880 [Acanthoscelides obtectus]